MIADFYVYRNVPNNKALIRRPDCQYCKHGKRRTPIKSDYNGEWIGLFGQPTAKLGTRKSSKNRIQWRPFCADRLGISRDDVLVES